MSPPSPTIRLAQAADLAVIMEIERQPGFEHYVGRSAEAVHERLMGDEGHAYLVGLDDQGEIAGFAILRDIGNPQGGVYLKRIAIRTPGSGYGSALLAAVMDWVFALGDSHRFHLDHFSDNLRAHRAYEKCGLRQEGILRQAYRLPDGRFADLTVMAILRPEWHALRRIATRAAELEALTTLQRKLRAKGLAGVAEERQRLLAPLGQDTVPDVSPEQIDILWQGMERLHEGSLAATVVAYHQRHDDESAAAVIRRLAADIELQETVDIVFSHQIGSPTGFVSWLERFTGALSCSFGRAIEMIEALEATRSPVCQDYIVMAARDGGWSIWVNPEAITRTRAGR